MSNLDVESGGFESLPLLNRSIVSHLEFLGYAASDSNSFWIAFSHPSPRKWNLSIAFHKDQVVLSASVRLGEPDPVRHRAVREALNRLNKVSTAVRYMFREREDGWAIRMVMHLPPRYRREEFGANIAIWEDETQQVSIIGDAYCGDGDNDGDE